MKSFNSVKDAFRAIGVDFVLAKEPFVRGVGANDIFSMDIRRRIQKNTRSEYVVIYPGHEDNIISVACHDKKWRQLVLVVREPVREFDLEVRDFGALNALKRGGIPRLKEFLARRRGGLREAFNDVFKKNDKWYEKIRTPGTTRYYLVGVDERQLFMCQLPKPATSVKAAHDTLKMPTIHTAEGQAVGRTVRQGEWFFLNPTDNEKLAIKEYFRNTKVIHRKASINYHCNRIGGKAHIAEELIVINSLVLKNGFSIHGRGEVFVRGAIRHPDHKTVRFAHWRKVIANRETRPTNGPITGSTTWID